VIKKLSIIMPVYNEEKFVARAVRQVMAVSFGKIQKELIVINDGSTDGTSKELRNSRNQELKKGNTVKIITLRKNLEYDPKEIPILLRPISDGDADVVYGSRFLGDRPHRVLFFWHMLANNLLTLVSNMCTNLNLTDMETGYKMFTRKVAGSLDLKENRFGMEPEFTAKIAKMNARVYEMGISYHGRNYQQGKKIGWRDGFQSLWCILKYNLFD